MTKIKKSQELPDRAKEDDRLVEGSETVIEAIDEHSDLLWRVNQEIWTHPELALEEHHAHGTLVSALRKRGFNVQARAFGLNTSFVAEAGSGGRVVAFNAEYDALPGIGHACGHNLIATASLGAFLGVAAALKKSGRPGRVRLLGTPAEEAHGGKIDMIKAGAYKDVDSCLMLHPASANDFPDGVLAAAYSSTLAVSQFTVTFRGTPSHAALAPWEGVNALDAAILGYNNVSALRQQIRSDERAHGIISHGGDAANIIPDKAVLEYAVRAPTLARTNVLKERVLDCFRGAAMATGCSINVESQMEYADLRTNHVISQAYQKAMQVMGQKVVCDFDCEPAYASTDPGNVSYECPSWQGSFGIATEEGVRNHTRGFTASAGTKAAFVRTVAACKGMAAVGLRILTDDGFAQDTRKEFEEGGWSKKESAYI